MKRTNRSAAFSSDLRSFPRNNHAFCQFCDCASGIHENFETMPWYRFIPSSSVFCRDTRVRIDSEQHLERIAQLSSKPKEARMKTRQAFFSLFAAVLFIASSALAQQVKTDYDRGVNFSQYKTYSWGQIHTENPLWVDRIKTAVNSALVSTPAENSA